MLMMLLRVIDVDDRLAAVCPHWLGVPDLGCRVGRPRAEHQGGGRDVADAGRPSAF